MPDRNGAERLYNGIALPIPWPPADLDATTRDPLPVPYLEHPPALIPIDVGRQLFVDDFLIETTTLRRRFHQPRKHPGNPVLRPETPLEMNNGICPVACPFSDGVFYDPRDQLIKMWYQAGWFDGVALAVSRDGIHWERPDFGVVPGTNRVVAPRNDFRRDGVSVWLDHEADDPDERFKMFHFTRIGKIGGELRGWAGWLLTSPDGIHWEWRGQTPQVGDNTTFFRNPFRRKWVFSIRSHRRQRTRDYWEHDDFLFPARSGWGPVRPIFWAGADKLDPPDPVIGCKTQLYKIDAVGYESLMLGLLQLHYGPPNEVCAKGGFPKLTELQLAFSRDGFHWDRGNRQSFIGASRQKGDWERGYIHSVGGCCLAMGDKLHFYYGAFQGDEGSRNPHEYWSGMYAHASTGLAILRRDGFASMDADGDAGMLTTRPLTFRGKRLFVNVDCPRGELRVEVLDKDCRVVTPFAAERCNAVSSDSTRLPVTWKGAGDLSALAGQAVRFRFHLQRGSIYAFWISPDESGASRGYLAAGGPV